MLPAELIARLHPTQFLGYETLEAEDCRVVALLRLGVSQLPSAGLKVQEGDVLFLAVSGERIDDVDKHLAAIGSGH